MGLHPAMGQGTEIEFVAAVEKVWKTAEKYGKSKGGFALGPFQPGEKQYTIIAA